MKLITVVLIMCSFALVACSKKAYRPADAGLVCFKDAGVCIDVGAGWLRIDAVPAEMCSPTLAGKPGLIQAYWARSEFPTAEAITSNARRMSVGQLGEEQAFRSDSGMTGRYFTVVKPPEKVGEGNSRITTIAVSTPSGRLLILDVIGPDGPLHETTRSAITRTLSPEE